MEHKTSSPVGIDLGQQLTYLQDVLAQLDTAQDRLNGLVDPGEAVFRDPMDVHHHITLGAVLSAHDLSAHYARRLDGLLAMRIDRLDALESLRDEFDAALSGDETIGEVLVRFLDMAAGVLEAEGRYAEWRRAFDRYARAFFHPSGWSSKPSTAALRQTWHRATQPLTRIDSRYVPRDLGGSGCASPKTLHLAFDAAALLIEAPVPTSLCRALGLPKGALTSAKKTSHDR